MARQVINTGSSANDHTGDQARTAYDKSNLNFAELYTLIAAGSVTISDTAPGSPAAGQLWWQSSTGVLWISYNDGNTTQWVNATSGQSGGDNGMTIVPRVIAASEIYYPSANLVFAVVEAVAGGGGGGATIGNASYIYGAGGGGSGAYSRRLLTAAQIGASQAATVGLGGNGGAAGFNDGFNGGDTSLGTLCVAKGGFGGQGYGGTGVANGGAGGQSSGGVGDATPAGNAGQPGGWAAAGSATWGGSSGGVGPLGGGNSIGLPGSGGIATGTAGLNYGAGGCGGVVNASAANAAGGPGGPGIIFITEYIGKQTLLGGNVNSAGTPSADQLAVWTGATAIQGVAPETVGASRTLLATYAPAGANAVIIGSSIFTSDYNVYEIENYVFNDTGASTVLACQFSIDGGSSFIATSGAYVFAIVYGTSTGSFAGSGGSSTFFQLDLTQDPRLDLPEISIMKLFKNLSGVFPMAHVESTSWNTGLISTKQSVLCQGTTAVVNGLKLFWYGGGNFGAGSVIKVYGIK